MKSRELSQASSLAMAAILAAFGATSAASAATKILYEVTHLDAPGVNTAGRSINERGWVAGFTTRSATLRQATLWKGSEAAFLESLAGPNGSSTVPWDGLNNSGMVIGISHTGQNAPLGEAWSCTLGGFIPASAGGIQTCLGFAWKDGVFTPLPTFPGGHNGFATGVNNSGQIVGWAENGIRDDSCDENTPQFLQFRAAVWDVRGQDVTITELPPLPGDEASAATAINERGDVVGISGSCDQAVGRFTARKSVLWRDGKPTPIGDLGSVSWNTPMAININDEVVGFANRAAGADGAIDQVAFYWNEHDGITNLQTLPGNTSSQAHGINTQGIVVGISLGGAPGNRAFIWKKGDAQITDLNTCVVAGYTGTLRDARDINDRGEITGSARDATGKIVAFVARPVPYAQGC